MKIVKPSAVVVFHTPTYIESGHTIDPEVFLESVGRICYKSEDRISVGSAAKFIEMLHDRGHHAMLEHCSASVKFITDRGVTHELVRHRLASFAQESTRYCNYSKEKFDRQIQVIEPPGLEGVARNMWEAAMLGAEESYMTMIEEGVTPQIARSVLPTCLKTEIWVTANLREWRHIFSLRCAAAAHPQIREIMLMALKVFKDEVPSMFKQLWVKYGV